MKRSWAVLLISVAALVQPAVAQETKTPSPQQIVGAPQGVPLSGEALETRTKEVASVIRCPTCQGLSIFDSPAAMAVNMKNQTRDLLAQGYTRDQILDYFEASYGEFVRLDPGMRGMNWLVWFAPLALLAAGIWAIVGFLRRSARRSAVSEPTAAAASEPGAEETIDPALLPYVLRVRELAYGWPGGVPPQEP